MKRLLYALPILMFAVVAYFLFDSLNGPPPQDLPTPLMNKTVPKFRLQALDDNTQGFSAADLATGHVTVINVFSSTCVPCHVEAPVIAKIANVPGIDFYGFVWKDTRAGARAFLTTTGNPFSRVGFDADGSVGLDWGITGWPQTFIIDGKGVVRDHFWAIDEDSLKNDVLPAIEKARASL